MMDPIFTEQLNPGKLVSFIHPTFNRDYNDDELRYETYIFKKIYNYDDDIYMYINGCIIA